MGWTTRVLNGGDPTTFVLSANVHRRHMTKGQRAMAVAKIYPEPERGRGKKDPAKGTEKVSYSRVKVARAVLNYPANSPAPSWTVNSARLSRLNSHRLGPKRCLNVLPMPENHIKTAEVRCFLTKAP